MLKHSDNIDSMLSNMLEGAENSEATTISTEIYQLPIRVGIKNQPLEKGDKPWIVGHFAPEKYLNETHPQGHDGVDLKAPAKTLVYPIASGIVFEVKEMLKGGKTCKVSHENGEVISYYAHMSQVLVQPQQKVNQKTALGIIGDTGNAKGRGEHLHYEVKVLGQKTDPMSIVGKHVGSLSRKKNAEWHDFYSSFFKESGMIKIPQELYKEIEDFTLNYFCSRVYKYIDFELNFFNKHHHIINKYSDIFNHIIKNLNKLEEIIKNKEIPLKASEEIHFEYGDLKFFWEIKYHPALLKYDFNYSIQLLDEISISKNYFKIFPENFKKSILHFVTKLSSVFKSSGKKNIELNLIKRDAKKYIKNINDNNYIKKIRYNNCLLTVELKDYDPSDGFRGQFWSDSDLNYYIDINIISPHKYVFNDLYFFIEEINTIKRNITHELQHFMQRYNANMKFTNSFDEKIFGLSGKTERSRKFDKDGVELKYQDKEWEEISEEALIGRQQHSLRDIEFYPRLSDSIDKFNEIFGNYPLPIKESAAKVWIGLPNNYSGKIAKLFATDEGFLDLMNNYHRRWRKAVKQFWKAVFDDEIKIDAEDKNDGFEKTAGLVKVPNYLINEITEFVHAYFADRVYKNIRGITGDLEIERLKKLSKKIINNFEPKISDTIEFENGYSEFAYQKHNIIVEIRIGKKTFGGNYDFISSDHYIMIYSNYLDNIKTVDLFNDELSDLRRIVNHELIHMFQEMYKKEFKLNNYYGLPGKDEDSKYIDPLGFLRKKYRTEEDKDYHDDKKRLSHELRDIEFYPRLADTIEQFNRKYKNYPEEMKDKIAKIWIGAKPGNLPFYQNIWFLKLKNENDQKYRKAVKEFWKVIFNE